MAGLGGIGLGYDLDRPPGDVFTHTRAFMADPGFRLVGGLDPSPARRELFTGACGRPAWTSFEEASRHMGQVDVVVLATPTILRLDVVRRCLELRPKIVLLEKPLAASLAEGRQVTDLCRDHGVLLAVNYFRRFDPVLRDAVHTTQAGALVQATCRYTGGLLQSASHYVDLFLYWHGMPLDARLLYDDGPCGQAGEDRRLGFLLEYPEARIAFHPVQAPYGFGEMDLLFKEGRLRLEDQGERVAVFRAGPDPLYPGYRRLLPERIDEAQALRYLCPVTQALYGCLSSGDSLPSTGDTALQTLTVCDGLLHDAKNIARRP
ncbi:scyllo-inositol 2-dehydrogenase (NAD(+)) [Fundidesulfovibrio magnetotacticus]|uniref:Scyllo-inositol 2-dehydrogenase (NAD(+)) n=1 Tax=Fundidesulfovibrio magnetotacticus TaxID=2730080 RepID=A0A6V8LQS7_9BACT|nr:scyllo-inositol 2-dehydrogenase (NAD(+)) [Fundidesulfovibrio magnetotacticus]